MCQSMSTKKDSGEGFGSMCWRFNESTAAIQNCNSTVMKQANSQYADNPDPEIGH